MAAEADHLAFLDAQRAKIESIKAAAEAAEEQAQIVLGLRQRMDQIDTMMNVKSNSVLEPSEYASEYERLQTMYGTADDVALDPMVNLSPRMQVDSVAGTALLPWQASSAVGSDPEVEMWRKRHHCYMCLFLLLKVLQMQIAGLQN